MNNRQLLAVALVAAATTARAAPPAEWQTLWWNQHEGSETQVSGRSIRTHGQHVNLWMRIKYAHNRNDMGIGPYDAYSFRADFDCAGDMMTVLAGRFSVGDTIIKSFDTPLPPVNIEPDTERGMWEPVVCASLPK